MKHRLIVTDLDGVIRHFPRERDNQIESRFGLPIGSLAKKAFEPGLLQSVITGKISDEEWRGKILYSLTDAFPGLDVGAAHKAWSDFPGIVDFEVLSFLEKLAGESGLVLLTNATSRLSADLRFLGIERRFKRIFNSSELGVAKPAAEIFHAVSHDLGLSPGEGVFIDDSAKNAMAAEAAGFRAVHFAGIDGLRDQLAKL
jgi:putative hydrolase of the HAD superfamily